MHPSVYWNLAPISNGFMKLFSPESPAITEGALFPWISLFFTLDTVAYSLLLKPFSLGLYVLTCSWLSHLSTPCQSPLKVPLLSSSPGPGNPRAGSSVLGMTPFHRAITYPKPSPWVTSSRPVVSATNYRICWCSPNHSPELYIQLPTSHCPYGRSSLDSYLIIYLARLTC